jgi:hypothetical protein
MDFGIVGGIVGLVGAGLQAQAQANQLEFEYAQLNWQKERAGQQDWFAQAGRTDMYGNQTSYDPVLNKWVIKLTPEQQTLRDAGTKEQLLQLTQDAPAARKIRQAVQQRAQEAKAPFHTAELGYQYAQPPSEEAIRSQLTGLMATNDMLRSKADQALIMRSAMRMGTGARAADIIQATDQQLGNAQTQNNRMLQARQSALQEFAARLQQHEAQWGTPMKVWGDLMSQGGDLPNIPKSTMDQSLNAQIAQQMAGKMSAFQSGTQGVSSAMQAVANAMGKSPDLSAAASAFGKMKMGEGKSSKEQGGQSASDTYDPTQPNYMGWSSFGQSDWGSGRNDYGFDMADSAF